MRYFEMPLSHYEKLRQPTEEENQRDFDAYVDSLRGSFNGQKPMKRDIHATPRNRNGYVYLLHAIHDPTLFKIGRASNPHNRLRTFNVKIPFPVEYECVIKTYDMYRLEKELHNLYGAKRLDGEFFCLNQIDVEFIKWLASA